MVYRFIFDKRSPNWDPNTGSNLNFLFLSAVDHMCEVKFAKRGTLLLDEVLDELGIPHIPHHCVGWHEGVNRYEMDLTRTEAKNGRVKGYEILFDCKDVFPTANDFNTSINLDAQFIKNKMALRGANIKDLQTMEGLLKKYFPKGLLR